MKQSRLEQSVGLFVLVGIAAITYLAVKIGGGSFMGSDSYTLFARFNNVSGLNAGSNVEIAGVKVGTIHAIVLDTEAMVAMVELKIDKEISLDDDTIASIKTNGLIGDKYLSLNPGGSGLALEEEETIVDTESSVDIEGLISRFAFGGISDEK